MKVFISFQRLADMSILGMNQSRGKVDSDGQESISIFGSD